MSEAWTGSKKQKAALREKYGGRCAYCGEMLTKMHADHLQPIVRITTDPWGRPLSAEDRKMLSPERNIVSNMMPSCAPCNLNKGGFSLDGWRELLSRSAAIVAREKSIFRAAVRFGLIEVKDQPVVFYFERNQEPCP
ncbi:HNH endonuclease [Paracoccus aminophilus]|uniref:HNH endonuclease n=1 Tax=Paracoccus aminophilus TaxID=34003 RepID=UPI0005A066AE|nr:HNH endonuclease signature motif containing protein [Paracoccus aminophilus]